jgi:hypothetical protein
MKLLDQHDKRVKMGMSIYAEILLDIIDTYQELSMMGLLAQALDHKVASQATLIQAIKWLANNNFIKVSKSEGDSRMKNCSIMQRGTLYLKNFQ